MADHDRDVPPTWIQQLLARHEASLIRYAYRITRDAEQAKDVVQDAFLRLCREVPADLNGHATAWLYTVCRRRAIDIRRKEQRMTHVLDLEKIETDGNGNDPHEQVSATEESRRIFANLKRLPENQQEVLRLKFQAGLSYREIGEITGVTVSQVGVLIHRGIMSLKKHCGVIN